jgi:hypothetical protein
MGIARAQPILQKRRPPGRNEIGAAKDSMDCCSGAGYSSIMIRTVLTELALFATPFAVYLIFLWLTRAGMLHPDSWTLPRIAWLVMAALVLMIGSFVVLAQWSGAPPGSTYVPARYEDGKFVPGETR